MIKLEKAPRTERAPRSEIARAVVALTPGMAFWVPAADEAARHKARQAVHAARHHHKPKLSISSEREVRNGVPGLLFIAVQEKKVT